MAASKELSQIHDIPTRTIKDWSVGMLLVIGCKTIHKQQTHNISGS
jgi:hypothetical protein